MAKDPAMLWYWSDWHSGTTTLSRFLKGCYMDLLHAQFNSGSLSLEEIKTVLGSDFGQAWPTLQKKFAVDSTGKYFNVRLDEEKKKRAAYTESRRKNLESSHMDKHKGKHMQQHMENENENKNTDVLLKKELQVSGYTLTSNESKKADKLIEDVCKFFEVRTVVTSPTYNSIHDFAMTLCHRNEIDVGVAALEKYIAYKGRSQEQKHNVLKWIGTKAEHYRDGQWIMIDWEQKNKNYNGQRNATKGTLRQTDPEPGKNYSADGGF